jgi:hypothetical protein
VGDFLRFCDEIPVTRKKIGKTEEIMREMVGPVGDRCAYMLTVGTVTIEEPLR